MRELLKKQGFAPKLLVTDKLRPIRFGVPAAAAELPHERGLRRNNRTENSHRAHPLHRGLELRECSRILRCIGMARGYARLPARRGARGTRSGAICVTNGGVMGVSNKRFPLVPPARHAAGDHVAPTLEPNPGAGAPENIGAGIDRIWSAADGLYCSGAGSTARTAPRNPQIRVLFQAVVGTAAVADRDRRVKLAARCLQAQRLLGRGPASDGRDRRRASLQFPAVGAGPARY